MSDKKINVFELVDPSIAEYWRSHGLTNDDFYCRDCGKLLIDLRQLKNVKYVSRVSRKTKKEYKAFLCLDNRNRILCENDDNRWCVSGRKLGNKIFFRHICWDCLFKKIPTVIMEQAEAYIEKRNIGYWKRLVKRGTISEKLKIPPHWNSPVWWFKLVFDITDEELQVERKKFDTASLESFVRRFGKEDGEKRFKEYQEIQAKNGCTLEYFVEKLGKEEGTKKYQQVCESKGVTKKNCIEKYGEEVGLYFFNQYCARQAYAGNSLLYFIEKLGKEEGIKKYAEVTAAKELRGKSYSNKSQELFKMIDEELGDYAKASRWEKKNFEYELFIEQDGVPKLKRVDYYLNGKIIEFNGDFWHANPDIYSCNDTITRFDGEVVKVKDIWNYDKFRKESIEKLGYKVLVIWEAEFNQDEDGTVQKCVSFLKQN